MSIKIGDVVRFELSSLKLDPHIPRWDFEIDQGGSGTWGSATVVSIDLALHQCGIKLAGGRTWYVPLPTHTHWDASRPGWYAFGLATPRNYIWEESVPYGYPLPPEILKKAIEKGTLSVQRTQRAWPYQKILNHDVEFNDKQSIIKLFWDDAK